MLEEEFDAQVLNGQLVPAEPLKVFEGQRVHVTVTVSQQANSPSLETPSAELADQVMLQPWAWFPDTPGGRIVRATPGPITLPDAPEIPPEEMPNDLQCPNGRGTSRPGRHCRRLPSSCPHRLRRGTPGRCRRSEEHTSELQ